MELDGRVALVTGANRGVGAETARQLAALGATVLVAARDPKAAAQAASQIDGRGPAIALTAALDVSDPDQVRTAADAVAAHGAGLDILINNAAAYVDWSETATGADLTEARRVFDTNLFGSWRLSQALLPLLRRSQHPRLVFVSSGGGSHGDDKFGLTRRGGAAASYGISKAAVNALVSTLAAELAETPVLVNAVCPGLTATYPGAEQMGARPVSDGASSVVWAATLPDGGPTGGFYRDGTPLPW